MLERWMGRSRLFQKSLWRSRVFRSRVFRLQVLQGMLFVLGIALVACSQQMPFSKTPLDGTASTPTAVTAAPSPQKTLGYQVDTLANSTVYTVKVPLESLFEVIPALSNQLATVEELARGSGAIAVLNGGFFDPENQKSTSPVILDGKQVAKPEDNERLMTNPDLLPYLDKILNRAEFRRYRCDGILRYDIALRQALPPPGCQLDAALGAGPQLLPNATLVQEGFLAEQNGKVVRDALGSTRRNARSAVGIAPDGSVVLVMVAQKANAPGRSGMTLAELADFMKSQKLEKGMNLDGGSSSSLHYGDQTFWGKVNENGQPIQRRVKSVLLVKAMKKPGA